jgi:hypothetical protein
MLETLATYVPILSAIHSISSVSHLSVFKMCEFRFAGQWQLDHLAFVQQQTPSPRVIITYNAWHRRNNFREEHTLTSPSQIASPHLSAKTGRILLAFPLS